MLKIETDPTTGEEKLVRFYADDNYVYCPICNELVKFALPVRESKDFVLTWCICGECGSVFPNPEEAKKLKPKEYEADYAEGYRKDREWKERSTWGKRVYATLIEDLTMGRKYLEVGHLHKEPLEFMRDRGWLTWGLDVCPGAETGKAWKLTGDYETFDFTKEVPEVNPGFDCIWMSHVIEHFRDPIKIMKRTYALLESGGVVFVASPDAGQIFSDGVREWGHWHGGEHWTMFRRDTFAKQMEAIGFRTILCRPNTHRRYSSWSDWHYLGQKIV